MPVGRKPKPTAVRRAEGTAKRSRGKKEPVPPAGALVCPDHLSKEARAEWDRIIEASPPGLLTRADAGVLATYCAHYARWARAEHLLQKSGLLIKTEKGNFIPNPLLGVANRASERMQKAAVELGFTPSARTRVSIPDKGRAPDAAGEESIEDFVKGGGLRLAL